jgi:Uncharacterized conserved protein (COG2071)
MTAPAQPQQKEQKRAVALKNPLTATSSLLDLVVVTWAVPAERVASLVPKGLSLDRLPNAEGELTAFVQFACALHAGRRWSPLPANSGDAFHRADFRVLVRPSVGEVRTPATFLLRAMLSTEEARLSMRAIAKEAKFGRFVLHIAGNPALGECERYELTLRDDDSQTTQITAEAKSADDPVPTPFASSSDMARFLLARDETYYAGSLSGVGKVPFTRNEYVPKPLQLVSAKLPFFSSQNILTESEIAEPLCVLYQPNLAVSVYPPRSAALD